MMSAGPPTCRFKGRRGSAMRLARAQGRGRSVVFAAEFSGHGAGCINLEPKHNRATAHLAVFDVGGAGISGVNKDFDTLATIGTINLLFC